MATICKPSATVLPLSSTVLWTFKANSLARKAWCLDVATLIININFVAIRNLSRIPVVSHFFFPVSCTPSCNFGSRKIPLHLTCGWESKVPFSSMGFLDSPFIINLFCVIFCSILFFNDILLYVWMHGKYITSTLIWIFHLW